MNAYYMCTDCAGKERKRLEIKHSSVSVSWQMTEPLRCNMCGRTRPLRLVSGKIAMVIFHLCPACIARRRMKGQDLIKHPFTSPGDRCDHCRRISDRLVTVRVI